MTTRIYTHPDCSKHMPGPDPSYAPARLSTILNALKVSLPEILLRVPSLRETRDLMRLVHTDAFLDQVLAPLAEGEQKIYESDTWAMTGTANALRAATALTIAATDDVMTGETLKAFCLTSPGGHHAEADMAQGFCFINHLAVAALYAQIHFGLKRIAILDIDAHHGNGVQNIFWNYPDRLYISVHEERSLSGLAHEKGVAENILNIPVPPGTNGAGYLSIFENVIVPKLMAFQPECLFLSVGFDGHHQDPLSNLALETEDYAWLARASSALADQLCHGRLVAILEGGYNLTYLGDCAVSFVSGLGETAA